MQPRVHGSSTNTYFYRVFSLKTYLFNHRLQGIFFGILDSNLNLKTIEIALLSLNQVFVKSESFLKMGAPPALLALKK